MLRRVALQASVQAVTLGVLASHVLRYVLFTGSLGFVYRSFVDHQAVDWRTWTWQWAWYLIVAYWSTSLMEYVPHRFQYHGSLPLENAVRHRVHHYAVARAPKGKLQQGLGLGYGIYHLPPFAWATDLLEASVDAHSAADTENKDMLSSSARDHIDDEKLLRARFKDVANFLYHVLLWYAIQSTSVRFFFPGLPLPRLLEASALILCEFLVWDVFHPLTHDHMGSFDEHSERFGPPQLVSSFVDKHRDVILGTWPISWVHAHHEIHHSTGGHHNFCGLCLGADVVFGCEKVRSAVHAGKTVALGKYVHERLTILHERVCLSA